MLEMVAFIIVPGGHAMHAPDPLVENVPYGQGLHALEVQPPEIE
jgi:hypothetical protein